MTDLNMSNNNNLNKMLLNVYNYVSSLASGQGEKEKIDRILEAMRIVDRKFFVEDGESAYQDDAKPIGAGQTISQPSTVARMLMLVNLEEKLNVLEAGSGSGWNACLMAYLIYPGNILSTEIISQLAKKTESNVQNFKDSLSPNLKKKFKNIKFMAKNVFSLKKSARYDRILFTAGITDVQEYKIENFAKKFLKENGILLCPYRFGPLMLIKKRNMHISKIYTKEYYSFVPLISFF